MLTKLHKRREAAMDRMFQTRSHQWAEVGLARQLSVAAAKKARVQILVFLPLLIGVLFIYSHRKGLVGAQWAPVVRYITVIALVILGWALARDMGRAAGPQLFRRLDPGTAGTVGFLLRLIALATMLIVALRIAGLRPQTLAVGGAFTAVVLGLAAQQTLGNLIAGTVLLSARPFRVGERVKLQAGGLAGNVEGVVSSLGLLYTTLAQGEDRIMVPNSLVLSAAVVPLREPESVDVRARLRAGVRPSEVQDLLDSSVRIPTRSAPDISLEEIDGDEVVVRIAATPAVAKDGPKLADEIISAVGQVTRDAA
jgi:small-conductance mechanosensitive channel